MRYRRADVAGGSYFYARRPRTGARCSREPAAVALFLGAVEKVRARDFLEVDAYVVLPDHLHALWTLPVGDANFSTRWRCSRKGHPRLSNTLSILSAARAGVPKASRAYGNGDSREHAIRDEADFAAHLDYIHIDPVKHGLVIVVRDWPLLDV